MRSFARLRMTAAVWVVILSGAKNLIKGGDMLLRSCSALVRLCAVFCLVGVLAAADEGLWIERTVGVKKKPSDKSWLPMQTFTLSQAVAKDKMDVPRLDKYGGYFDHRGKATGFFRVDRRSNGWQLVDPEGCDFVSIGVCGVTLNSTENGKKALEKKFGNVESWTKETSELLRRHGFNTLACWSAYSMFNKAGCPMAYTPILNWMSGYGKKRGGTYQLPGHMGYPADCIFVFDPGFEEYCNEEAGKLAANKDDPWLLGYFSDNELPLSGKILSRYLGLPEGDAGRQAASKWFSERTGGGNGKPSQEDEDAFLELVTDRYHRIVNQAIKKHDPNHMYIGSRIHGSCFKSAAVLRGYGRNVDIMSINYYHAWNPSMELSEMWAREGGKPFMITEWYARGADSGMGNTTGAGWLVQTQAERGYFYQTFTRELLSDRNCVGWHWFKYIDNDPSNKKADPSNLDSNKGMVSMVYEPYGELLDAMLLLNAYVYPLIDTMRKD